MFSKFKPKEEVFLEKEISGEPTFTSESYDRIQKSLQAMSGENLDQEHVISKEEIEFTQKIIDQIHLQAATNLAKWDSIEYPGVSELVSSINVLDLLTSLGIDSKVIDSVQMQRESLPKELTVISSSTPSGATLGLLTGSKTTGLTDGGSHTGFDIIVGRTMQELSRLIGSIKRGEPFNPEIILTGSPLATGGSVTTKFANKIKEDGIFETQARLHAEMLNPKLSDKNVRRIIFHGHSFASTQSILTASHIDRKLYSKVSVLADDPVITHGKRKYEIVKGVQVILGAMLDGAYAAVGSFNDDAKAKPIAHKSYLKQLERLGISINDSRYNEDLKGRLNWIVLKQVLLGPFAFKNSNLDKEYEFPIYMRKGLYDPSKISIKRIGVYLKNLISGSSPNDAKQAIIKAFKQEGPIKGKEFPIRKLHSIDRVTPKYLRRWIRTGVEAQTLSKSNLT